jgi:hypothetical protein
MNKKRASSNLKSSPVGRDWAAGNEAKYLSYREAWARIRLARKHKYFLEAVTIEESIISDRLLSYLEKYRKLVLKKGTRDNLNQVIERWHSEALDIYKGDVDAVADLTYLHTRLVAWRDSRNEIVHGIVKSKGLRLDDHICNFLAAAKKSAKKGDKIARQICQWVKKQKALNTGETG